MEQKSVEVHRTGCMWWGEGHRGAIHLVVDDRPLPPSPTLRTEIVKTRTVFFVVIWAWRVAEGFIFPFRFLFAVFLSGLQ